MKNEMKEFLAEGLKYYKKANLVMSEFSNSIQTELLGILKNRENWGPVFKPGGSDKIKILKYGGNTPIFVAQIEGKVGGTPAPIRISINWQESEYPFYEIWFFDGPPGIYEKFKAYKKKGRVEQSLDRGLKMYPDPDDFDIERDLIILIDEFVSTISK